MGQSKKTIYVAGHTGMVGSAIVRHLLRRGDCNVLTKSSKELDLINQRDVQKFFAQHQIDEVYLAAARVGGIEANDKYPAEFIYENMAIQTNVTHSAFSTGVRKLLFIGSSCIYPKFAPQPLKESSFLSAKLEPTNEAYAVAKIAGITMCNAYNKQYGQSHGVDFRSVMPTNLFGPNDNYHPNSSHVMAALIRKIHFAKENNEDNVSLFGSGNPLREFLYVDDLAAACDCVMSASKERYENLTSDHYNLINVGSGVEVSIRQLAETIMTVLGFKSELRFDLSKPDGTPRKFLDSSLIHSMGWKPTVTLENGVRLAYQDFVDRLKH